MWNSAYLVKSVPVYDGVAILGVGRRGARGLSGTLALLLHPRVAVRVHLVAHAVGAAHGQAVFRHLE
jgi:hypothetical protein